jgi:hypothetical protein
VDRRGSGGTGARAERARGAAGGAPESSLVPVAAKPAAKLRRSSAIPGRASNEGHTRAKVPVETGSLNGPYSVFQPSGFAAAGSFGGSSARM